MIQGVEGWVEKPALTVEGGVKNVGSVESSGSKAWYVGAVQSVPTRIQNRFQILTNEEDEDEEEEFQDCREIRSLVDSSSSEEDNVPSREELERMRRMTGGRVRRERKT
eukprot:2373339-Karenia_brevis.AAC.1